MVYPEMSLEEHEVQSCIEELRRALSSVVNPPEAESMTTLVPPEVEAQLQLFVPLWATPTPSSKRYFDVNLILGKFGCQPHSCVSGLLSRPELFKEAAALVGNEEETKGETKQHVDSVHGVQIILLQGVAGSGKSLTAWHTWRRQVQDMLESDNKTHRIPLLVSLPEFKAAALGNTRQSLMECYLEKYFSIPASTVAKIRGVVPFLIILDGLDEVVEKVNLLESQLYLWKRSVFVVTCRSGHMQSGDVGRFIAPCRGTWTLSHWLVGVNCR